MNLKGFILEDGRGREFVMMCERPHMRLGQTFALRGWQRRRLVPLQYPERELRKIIGGVLCALDDLFRSLPKLHEHIHRISSDSPSCGILLKRKSPALRKVIRREVEMARNERL